MEQNRPPLLFTTLVASLGGFLFGFDMAVVSGILPFVEHQFGLSPSRLGWFVSSALAGCIVGVVFAGDISDRLGRKKLMLFSAGLFVLTAIGCTVIPAFSWLIAARILGGMAVGIASSVVPLYLSEIAPDHLRGRLVTYYQLAVTIGIFSAYASNALLLKYTTAHSWFPGVEVWRKMFGAGIFPALLFFTGVIFIPESPRWQKQRHITTGNNAAAYTQLGAPRFRRALLIAILLPLFSQFSGINAIIYYGPTILHQSGITLDNSLISQLFFGAANVAFTFIAIWKVDTLGRRPLYLWGTAGAAISLLLTGICFYTGAVHGIYLLLCVLAFLACFAFSIGPLKFVIAAEIFPDSIRAKALSLSIMVMWTADAIMGQLTPVLLASWGTPATFWCFASCCVLAFVTVYKLVPETRGQSIEAIQQNWEQRGMH
ncbi:hypothetical protein HA402_012195 [Bradysia odoriphaga]|nr:hypothetical protein HA402_012195 [Bradysia odoriphaga]